MRILITGSTGLLGPYLMTAFSKAGEVYGISSKICDLTDEKNVRFVMGNYTPEIIVHAAAWTDVDGCALKPLQASVSNCGMVENIVDHMPKACRLIYISTDMVYSGPGPHRENSKSENPINMYGMSKFMGEFAAAKAKDHLIVRTNMYGINRGARKTGLVEFLISEMKTGAAFGVFTDVMFSPLWTQTLAEKLVVMARSKRTGTFNVGATNSMSKAKFAMTLANEMGWSCQGMRPVESTSLIGRAPRPLDTRMDIQRVEVVFGLEMPTTEADIKAMCESIKCTN